VIRTRRAPDGSVEAVAEVVVGVDAMQVVVSLGHTTDPVDAGGLRDAPVVVLTDATLARLVLAGVERAGQASVATMQAPWSSTPGAGLLEAASSAEVVVMLVPPERAAEEALIVARALGGRPLPVVPLDDLVAARAMLDACWIDLDVAIPSLDEAARDRARGAASELGLFLDHHVVEVDPRPGLGTGSGSDVTLHELTAASTGVLAGRIAAGNRRWR
jgi:hypothetical protein